MHVEFPPPLDTLLGTKRGTVVLAEGASATDLLAVLYTRAGDDVLLLALMKNCLLTSRQRTIRHDELLLPGQTLSLYSPLAGG